MIVLIALAIYAAAGVAVAAAFVALGVTRVPADAGLRRGPRADFPRRGRALALRADPLAQVRPMKRAHRSAHRALWPILAVAVALGLTMALLLRKPADAHSSYTTETRIAEARAP